MAAWILVNVNRDSAKKSEPFSLDEVTSWLGYARPGAPAVPRPATPATPEELKQKLDVVHMLHRGLYGENGSGGQKDG